MMPTAPRTAVRTRPATDDSPRTRTGIRAWFDLTKPGITRLVLVTTGVGFYLGASARLDLILLINTIFATALVASGANALNQYAERDADALMRRTAQRPIPSGRIGSLEALLFGAGLAFIGLVHLWFLVNPTTALIVAASLFSYVFAYTPLKRRTWLSTLVGTVPGALPALAGWTAATGSIGAGGLAIFAIVLVWQLPHFFALGWMYREDYLRGGFRVLAGIDPDGNRTARWTVLTTIALIPVSLLPAFQSLTGTLYAAGATVLGLIFLAITVTMSADRTRTHARRVFLASILYLPALLALLVIDKV